MKRMITKCQEKIVEKVIIKQMITEYRKSSGKKVIIGADKKTDLTKK
jgi:hypothetical protein